MVGVWLQDLFHIFHYHGGYTSVYAGICLCFEVHAPIISESLFETGFAEGDAGAGQHRCKASEDMLFFQVANVPDKPPAVVLLMVSVPDCPILQVS